MSTPSIAPFPPVSFRKELVPTEWEACLDAWISLVEYYLRLPAKTFESAVQSNTSLAAFLISYYHESAQEHGHSPTASQQKSHTLHRSCFLLTHRTLVDIKSPPSHLLGWQFLSNFSHAYSRSRNLEVLLEGVWQIRRKDVETSLQSLKTSLLKQLESSQPSTAEADLRTSAPLFHASSEAGHYLMAGSDLIDAMSSSYKSGSQVFRQRLVIVTYLGVTSLLKGEKPNHSMLFDHLYSLKSQAGSPGASASLLADLVTNTPLLMKLRTLVVGKDAERARNLAASLDPYRSSAVARQRATSRRRPTKGKQPANDSFGHGAISGEQHMHRMSLITQIQDLFPELGSGFITRLLDEYSENVEQVTAHLLDDSLPPHLATLDRTAQLAPQSFTPAEATQQAIDHLAPRSTPPPQRRNIYDNDDFDRLEHETSRLHIGRANATATADSVLASRPTEAKSAILSALAAFDSDDDERDDTYDEADVGGTVDHTGPDGEHDDKVRVNTDDPNEESLFRAWKMDPGLFSRGSDTRRSAARAALRLETNMTDEGVEGWGIMLARDPARRRRLELKFSAFDGQQGGLERTAYRDNGDDGGDSAGGERGGFRGRGRGMGRGRGGGRGGSVAGAPNESGTQVARDRKEAHKGSRANHNRRDQRARKMARGGFPG